MSNAAIFLHPNGFDTTGQTLLGRTPRARASARLRASRGRERYFSGDVAGRPRRTRRSRRPHRGPRKPITWIPQVERGQLAQAGVSTCRRPRRHRAWGAAPTARAATRSPASPHHRTGRTIGWWETSDRASDDYDALICTSSAVRASVETQLTLMRDYLADLHGPAAA